MMAACETDIDKTIYDSSKATPAVLETPASTSIVLDSEQQRTTAVTLTWVNPQLGYQAIVTNNIQMDLAGNGFANARTIATAVANATSQDLTTSTLNNDILTLLKDAGITKDYSARDFEFRIISHITEAADTLYSNTLTLNITPYDADIEYPSIRVRGAYANNWDWAAAQKVYSMNNNGIYEGMIYFDGKAADGWKFCADEKWSTNWGVGETTSEEASELTLTSGGGNIEVYSRNCYYFVFNSSTGVMTVSWAHDSWGVVGAHNGWGTPDTPMTLGMETDDTGAIQHYLTATIDFDADATWKLRPDSDTSWPRQINAASVSLEGDVKSDGTNDNNFQVTAGAGSYTIKWYFNKVQEQQRVVVTKN